MENTTAFVDLVSFPSFCSRVKNRLFLQMFSGFLFALSLLSLLIFFYHQFSSCRCSDFASQALPFFDFSSIFLLFFLYSSCCLMFAGSNPAVLPPDVWLWNPSAGPFLHQKQMTTLEETEFESICPASSSQRQGSI